MLYKNWCLRSFRIWREQSFVSTNKIIDAVSNQTNRLVEIRSDLKNVIEEQIVRQKKSHRDEFMLGDLFSLWKDWIQQKKALKQKQIEF